MLILCSFFTTQTQYIAINDSISWYFFDEDQFNTFESNSKSIIIFKSPNYRVNSDNWIEFVNSFVMGKKSTISDEINGGILEKGGKFLNK